MARRRGGRLIAGVGSARFRSISVALVVGALAVALIWTALADGAQQYETYESTIAGDGPAAQYRFDDSSGSSTLTDSAGSATATNTSISLGEAGPFGASKSGLFGGSAYATLPSDPLNGASEFTAEAWVDWAGESSFEQPIFDLGSSAFVQMSLTPSASGSMHPMRFEIHPGSGSPLALTATKLTANHWEYLAVTETSAGTVKIYLNGEAVAEATGATVSPATLGSTT